MGETELSQAPQHPGDLATDVTERQTAAALQRTVDTDLRRIEAALARIDAGRFGACEVCGRDIEDDRLEVAPSARTCIEHREREASLPEPV